MKILLIISAILISIASQLYAKDDIILSNEISSPTSFVPQPFDVIHYDVTCDFTKAPLKDMSGVCGITVHWLEKSDTNKFYFHLRSLNVDSAFYEGIKVVPVEVGTTQSATYHYEIDYQPLIQKDTVVITIYYSGAMTAEPGTYNWGGVQMQYNTLYAMGVGLLNNYVSATQHWIPCYDHPSDKATFHGKFIVQPGKTVASIGIITSHYQEGDNDIFEWTHNFLCSTYLYTFAVADYVPVIISEEFPPVVVYSLPIDTAKVNFVFRLLPRTIRVYERRFGNFPFEKAGYAITPKGSMEHETLVCYDTTSLGKYFRNKDTLNMVGAHELAHQWFGDYVTCRDFRDAWLNEGFATFCESIWMEDIAGFEGYLNHQQAKIEEYLGTIAAQEGALPLYDFPRTFPSYNYPWTIYNKGAAVLGMLRYELGDSIFFGAINEYLKRLALGNSTTDTLQKICEEYSGKDLGWFFQQWVYDKGWPILDINEDVFVYDTTGLCRLTLTIKQIDPYVQIPYINLPLEMKISFNNDSSAIRMLKINDWNDTMVFDSIPSFRQITYNRGPSLRALIEIHSERTDVSEKIKLSSDLIAYPNPADNFIRLLFKKDFGKINLKLYNILGEEVKCFESEINNVNEIKSYDIADLPIGVYILVVYSGKSTDSIRISVQH